MRQIKFRVWDNVYQTFIDKSKYEIVFSSSNSSFGKMILRWNDYLPEEMLYPPNQILNQFTGLLDKNGKEIYEGDILKNSRQWSYGLRSGSHFVVEFNVETGRYGLLLRGEHLRDSWEDLAALTRKKSNECEVIGNIYENPELLNNK